MKQIFSLILFASIFSVADAHTLGMTDGLIARLGHQLLGLHHLPFTLLLIVFGLVALRRLRKKDN